MLWNRSSTSRRVQFNATVSNTHRTNNETEAWNKRVRTTDKPQSPVSVPLTGQPQEWHCSSSHCSGGGGTWTAAEKTIQASYTRVTAASAESVRCSKSVGEVLRGLGHTIRFVWVLKITDVTWHRHKIRTVNVKYAVAALSIMQLMPDTLELHICAHFYFACFVYS